MNFFSPRQIIDEIQRPSFQRNCDRDAAQIMADVAAEILRWRDLQGRYSATIKAIKIDRQVSLEKAQAMAAIELGLEHKIRQELDKFMPPILLGDVADQEFPTAPDPTRQTCNVT